MISMRTNHFTSWDDLYNTQRIEHKLITKSYYSFNHKRNMCINWFTLNILILFYPVCIFSKLVQVKLISLEFVLILLLKEKAFNINYD